MKASHMTFGVDRRGTAIVAMALSQWWHEDRPDGFAMHLPLELLAPKGRQYVCRALGNMALGSLACYHREIMTLYVFAPITPSPLFDPASNVTHLVPEPGVRLPIHTALGLADDEQSLEFSENDEANKALPGTVRSVPLVELEKLGPDGAATQVGYDVLDTLMRLYPAVFAPHPQLARS